MADLSDRQASALRVWLAMSVVYVVWGSTYLAIRVVVADLPPLVTAGARFLIAGAILGLVVLLRRGRASFRLERRQLAAAALVGAALLLGGNGLVVLAEQSVPSAFTALVIAATPLWVILFRRLARDRIPRGSLIGVLVGFLGVGFLVVPAWTGQAADPLALGMLLLATVSWATGSFISSRVAMPADPFASTTIQMLVGGALLLAAGLLTGEPFEPATWAASADAFLAWLYLIFVGSLAGYTAYTWVLQHAPISRVATYAYVNPVVAVILGVVILQETITSNMLVGGLVIVGSVALIIRNETLSGRPAESSAAAVTVEEIG